MLDSTTARPTLTSPLSEASPEPGRLTGRVVRREELSAGERRRLWLLLGEHFANASRQRFEQDLAEKQWVVLVADAQGEIQGFSTVQRLETALDGEPIVAYFSGDTVVHRDHWGEPTLPSLWSRHVFRLAAAETHRAYWFLISSGYKTYRFLPVFFREFFPRWDRPTPARVRRLLDHLGALKYPSEYDPSAGVVRFRQPMPLRAGIAELTEGRLRDPHVVFFGAANPGHTLGDELACVTEIHPDNVTRAGRRMLGLPRMRKQ